MSGGKFGQIKYLLPLYIPNPINPFLTRFFGLDKICLHPSPDCQSRVSSPKRKKRRLPRSVLAQDSAKTFRPGEFGDAAPDGGLSTASLYVHDPPDGSIGRGGAPPDRRGRLGLGPPGTRSSGSPWDFGLGSGVGEPQSGTGFGAILYV